MKFHITKITSKVNTDDHWLSIPNWNWIGGQTNNYGEQLSPKNAAASIIFVTILHQGFSTGTKNTNHMIARYLYQI